MDGKGQELKDLTPPSIDVYDTHPYVTIEEWLNDEVFPHLNERILLITIDEFEEIGKSIQDGSISERVLSQLRHLMQHSTNMVFMFTRVQTLKALGPRADSYFISSNTIELGYLEKEAAEALIRNPEPSQRDRLPDYKDEIVEEIIRLTHCHPYLIQALCSELINIANEEQLMDIDLQSLEAAIQRVYKRYESYFRNILEDAGEGSQSLLKKLAQQPAPVDEFTRESNNIEGLIARHVVCKLDDELFAIEIPLVARWINESV